MEKPNRCRYVKVAWRHNPQARPMDAQACSAWPSRAYSMQPRHWPVACAAQWGLLALGQHGCVDACSPKCRRVCAVHGMRVM